MLVEITDERRIKMNNKENEIKPVGYVKSKMEKLAKKFGCDMLDLEFIFRQGYYCGRIDTLSENISMLQGDKR